METLIVVLIVTAAAVLMIRRFMKKLKPGSSCGCDGCAGCETPPQGGCGIQDKINVQDFPINRDR